MTKYSSLPFNTYIKRSLCEIKDFFEILKCVDKFHINYTHVFIHKIYIGTSTCICAYIGVHKIYTYM